MSLNVPGPEKLASLVSGVTQTMFGMSFRLAASRDVAPWRDDPPWTTVLLPIPGKQPVTIAIAADEAGGRVLGGQMFSCGPESLDPGMVDDSLRELANIVAGQVKSAMGLDQALGLPKLVRADGKGEGLSTQPWRTATLESGSTKIVVWVAVVESHVV